MQAVVRITKQYYCSSLASASHELAAKTTCYSLTPASLPRWDWEENQKTKAKLMGWDENSLMEQRRKTNNSNNNNRKTCKAMDTQHNYPVEVLPWQPTPILKHQGDFLSKPAPKPPITSNCSSCLKYKNTKRMVQREPGASLTALFPAGRAREREATPPGIF